MFGILESRKIWATDFRRQATDANELRHADAIVQSVAERLLEGRSGTFSRALLEDFLATYDHSRATRIADEDIFIACFCAESDNPTLWRNFAAGCTGYAIEFNVLADEKFRTPSDISVDSWPVEYDADRLRAAIESSFAAVLGTVGPVEDIAENFRIRKVSLLRIAALSAARFKAKSYSAEREFRLFVMKSRRCSWTVYDFPKRHVKVPLRRDRKALLSIRAIHIGSGAPPDAEARISALLDKLGYRGPQRPAVVRSSIPVQPSCVA